MKAGGRHGLKRAATDPLTQVQAENQRWWESTPMSYDWRSAAGLEPGSLAWFDHQDRRSDAEHEHFLAGEPAHRWLLGRSVSGLDVLEIGVGAGYNAESLARDGARLAGIDISRSAIELTQKRFALKGLEGAFEHWDAEGDREDFGGRFDVVWSWGVIHHSAHTARIVRNISRWLKPGGTFAGMVYHRDSSRLPVALAREWILRGKTRSTVDEALVRSTDGFSARFYPADQWQDLLLAFFGTVETRVSGLDVDLVPLPQAWRRPVWNRIPPAARRRALERVGHFLMFAASDPFQS